MPGSVEADILIKAIDDASRTFTSLGKTCDSVARQIEQGFSGTEKGFKQAEQGAKNLGGAMDGLKGKVSGVTDVLGKVGLAAMGIGAIAAPFIGIAKSAFESYSQTEKLSASLTSLLAKEISHASGVEKTIVVGTKQVEVTKKQIDANSKNAEKITGLQATQAKLSAQIAVYNEKLDAATKKGKESAAELALRRVNLDQMKAKLADVTNQIAKQTTEVAKSSTAHTAYVTVTKKVVEGQITVAQAMEKAKEQSKGLLEWVQKLAIVSPFEQMDIAKALKLQMAFGYTSDEAKKLTTSLTNWAAAAGVSGEYMERVSLALGKIKSQGKVTGETVMMLSEAGIGVTDMLKSMGVDIENVAKSGASADAFFKVFTDTLNKDFGQAAKDQANTMGGLTSSIKDIMNVGLREFFTATFQAIQPLLIAFVDTLSNPKFMDSIRAIGATLGGMVQAVITAFSQIGPVINNVVASIQQQAASMGQAFHPIVVAVQTVISAFQGFAAGTASITALEVKITSAARIIASALGIDIPTAANAVKAAFDGFEAAGQAVAKLQQALAPLGPAIQAVVAALSGDLKTAGALLNSLPKDWQNAVMQAVTVLAPLKNAVTEVVNGIKGVVADFGAIWKQEFSTIFTAVQDFVSKVTAAFQSGGLGAAIQKAADELPALMGKIAGAVATAQGQIVAEFGKIAQKVADAIGPMIPKVVSAFGQLVQRVADAIGPMIPKIVDAFGKIAQNIGDTLGKAWNTISPKLGELIQKIANAIGPMLPKIADAFGKLVGYIGDALGKVWSALSPKLAELGGKIVPMLIEGIKNLSVVAWTPISENFLTRIGEIFSNIGKTIGRILPGVIAGIIVLLIDLLGVGLTKVLPAILTAVANLAIGIAQGLADALGPELGKLWENTIKPALEGVIKSAQDKMSALDPGKIGAALIDGIIKGITGKVRELQTALSNAVGNLPQWAQDIIGAHSPATTMIPVGQAVVDGIIEGLISRTGDLEQAATALLQSMTAAFGKALTGAVGSIQGLLTNVIQAVNALKSIPGYENKDDLNRFLHIAENLAKWLGPMVEMFGKIADNADKLDKISNASLKKLVEVIGNISKYIVEFYGHITDKTIAKLENANRVLQNWDDAAAGISQAIGSLKELLDFSAWEATVEQVAAGAKSSTQKILAGLTEVANAILAVFGEMTEGELGAATIGTATQEMIDSWSKVASTISGAFSSITSLFEAGQWEVGVEDVAASVTRAVGLIATGLSTAAQAILDFFKNAGLGIGAGGQAVRDLPAAMDEATQALLENWKKAVEPISGALSNIKSLFEAGDWKADVTAIPAAVTRAVGLIATGLSAAVEAIVQFFELGELGVGAGGQPVASLPGVIDEATQAMLDNWKKSVDVISGVINALKSLLDAAGWEQDAAQVAQAAKSATEKLVAGLQAAVGVVVAALGGAPTEQHTGTATTGGATTTVQRALRLVPEAAMDALDNWKDAVGAISGTAGAIKSLFDAAGWEETAAQVAASARSGAEKLIAGLEAAVGAIVAALGITAGRETLGAATAGGTARSGAGAAVRILASVPQAAQDTLDNWKDAVGAISGAAGAIKALFDAAEWEKTAAQIAQTARSGAEKLVAGMEAAVGAIVAALRITPGREILGTATGGGTARGGAGPAVRILASIPQSAQATLDNWKNAVDAISGAAGAIKSLFDAAGWEETAAQIAEKAKTGAERLVAGLEAAIGAIVAALGITAGGSVTTGMATAGGTARSGAGPAYRLLADIPESARGTLDNWKAAVDAIGGVVGAIKSLMDAAGWEQTAAQIAEKARSGAEKLVAGMEAAILAIIAALGVTRPGGGATATTQTGGMTATGGGGGLTRILANIPQYAQAALANWNAAIGAIGGMVDAMSNLGDYISVDVSTQAGALAADLMSAAQAILDAMSAYAAAMGSLPDVTKEQGEWAQRVAGFVSAVSGPVDALQKLAEYVRASDLVTNAQKVGRDLIDAFEALKRGMGHIPALDVETANLYKRILDTVGGFANVAQAMTKLNDYSRIIGGQVDAVIGGLIEIMNALADAASTLGDDIVEAAEAFMNKVKPALDLLASITTTVGATAASTTAGTATTAGGGGGGGGRYKPPEGWVMSEGGLIIPAWEVERNAYVARITSPGGLTSSTMGLPGGGSITTDYTTGQTYRSYKHGGPINFTGPAVLHAGEYVLPADVVRNLAERNTHGYAGGNVSITFTGNISVRRDEDITRLADEIARKIGARQNLRTRMGVNS